jgi:hypothetical protein
MSYCITPRKSPRKLGKGVTSPSRDNESHTNKKWEKPHEEQLLDVLIVL